MKKKIICAILVTALAVTSFTGCGKAQDKDAAEVIMAETETRDPDITAEAQAAVDTLLPTETGKPVVTETATPTPKRNLRQRQLRNLRQRQLRSRQQPRDQERQLQPILPAPVRLVHPQQQQSRYQPRHRQQRPQLPHRHQYPLRPLVIIIMSRNIGRLHLLVTAVEIGLWSALSVGM